MPCATGVADLEIDPGRRLGVWVLKALGGVDQFLQVLGVGLEVLVLALVVDRPQGVLLGDELAVDQVPTSQLSSP